MSLCVHFSWFNFRSTKYLVSEGFYAFHNWFDEHTWYPYGRFIGATVYPGTCCSLARSIDPACTDSLRL